MFLFSSRSCEELVGVDAPNAAFVALIFRSPFKLAEEKDGVAVAVPAFSSPLKVRVGRRARERADRAILSVVFSSKVIPLEVDRVDRTV